MSDIADFSANLPRGGAVFEWYGGWFAVSAEVEASTRVEHLLKALLVQGSGRKRSIPDPEPPKSLHGAAQRAKKAKDRMAQARADAKAYAR